MMIFLVFFFSLPISMTMIFREKGREKRRGREGERDNLMNVLVYFLRIWEICHRRKNKFLGDEIKERHKIN